MIRITADVFILVSEIECDLGDTIIMKSGVIIYVEDRCADVRGMS